MPDPEAFDDFVRACSVRLGRIGCLLTGGDVARAPDGTIAGKYDANPHLRFFSNRSRSGRTMSWTSASMPGRPAGSR